ncbi:hypothetical protein A3Q56_04178 [Intoshia linei]|uniref:ATP-dependent RNA helicase Ski2/MTR4 C-terminal domain-containing protein n=1 Tax=Intoshia linei TaxID=1819745 RepID=A0A177B1D0_9BILA|nr:hypothetical protein A3Q56_04178 [Intoshia linei]
MRTDSFGVILMEPMYQWSDGNSFENIMENCQNINEGHMVRSVQRLDELIRSIITSLQLVDDHVMCKKMQECSTSIHRNIVFASSLYHK